MTRKQYYSMIWTYQQRRNVAQLEYSDALREMRRLTVKINRWQKAINRIDERNRKISVLVKKVNLYFGVNIKSKSMDLGHIFARSIFFKIGMENKIQGKFLAEFIGRNKRTAFRNRIALTRSFEKNTENLKSFHNFKQYLQNEETISQPNALAAKSHDLTSVNGIGKERA